MKKYSKYLLTSLILLFATTNASACWGDWYNANAYFMYRVYATTAEAEQTQDSFNLNAEDNCKSWQQLTSPAIPLKDIYDIVYKMPLEEYEALYENKKRVYENKFAQWITKQDTEILDFLLLAKTNEYIRLQQNSRWYYPTMPIGARMSIEELAEKALSMTDSRLRDRYLLQAVRALFTMGQYQQCIDIWDTEVQFLPEDNLMRRMILPYIAGAEFRVHHTERAMAYFAEMGDVESLLYCAGRKGETLAPADALALVCEYAPNSQYVMQTLQKQIRKLEPYGYGYWNVGDTVEVDDEFRKLQTLALGMAQDNRVDNPAMWYYTAAFLADLEGKPQQAAQWLTKAEMAKSTAYIDESIKVMRIYLNAKLRPVNDAYEQRLIEELKWLDKMIVDNLTDEVRSETAYGYKLRDNQSYYYWNDMMRRILIGEVCPRMVKAGRYICALQLANMADYRLLNLVDRRNFYDWKTNKTTSYTMGEYRNSDEYNNYDYRNHFFEMIDSLGLDIAIKYVENVRHSKSSTDRYLNERGYTANDYLNDILGTQYLRTMRYADAIRYLGAVSPQYKNHHNLTLEYDPFSVEPQKISETKDFKFDFACEMYALEQGIKLTTEPNRKAQLMVRYAIGLRNSFDCCWALTQYYRGSSYWGQVCEKRDWEVGVHAQRSMERATQMVNEACALFTDDELAANIHYKLCNFKTIAEKYPNTAKGQVVRGECDKLIDYHAHTKRERRIDYYNNW